MRSDGPRFSDIRSEDREMLQAAARRAGLSVSEWLDKIIREAASKADEQLSSSEPEYHEQTVGQNDFTIRSLHERLDVLAEKIDWSRKHNTALPHPVSHFDTRSQLVRIEDAINRLADNLYRCIMDIPTHTNDRMNVRAGFFSRLLSN